MSSSPFPYSTDNKRYHTWNFHMQETFGFKVAKASIDGGFTCPNLDGTKGIGGCIYCSSHGSGDFAGNCAEPIPIQIESQREMQHRKWPDAKLIAYFQAYSGTYASLDVLREKYEEALSCKNVIGLSIATRADLLSDEVIDYLSELSKRTYLLVELGLQSTHDETLKRINRCHTYAEFEDGFLRLQAAGIRTSVHIINYLPGETREMMMATVEKLSQLEPDCLKIHMLHVLQHTRLSDDYRNKEFVLPEMDEYIQLVCDQLECLPAEMVIQRLTGDASKDELIAPMWVMGKRLVLNGIDKELARRNSWQGKER